MKEIREKRLKAVQELLGDDAIELDNCPCLSCEMCHWKQTVKGTVSGYCKVRFDIVYSSKDITVKSQIVANCIDFDLAELN